MMKKIILLLFLLVNMLTFVSCSNSVEGTEEAYSGLKFIEVAEVNRLKLYDLDSLETVSDVIVVGTFSGNAEQEIITQYDEQVGYDTLMNVISYNDIIVSKVIKGDVNVGDTLRVAQEYAVVDNRFLTYSELTPMLEGDTWLFFLYNNYNSGIYYCSGDSDGRYPLKNCTYKRNALTENEDLGVYEKENFNEKIYNEILEKYDF